MNEESEMQNCIVSFGFQKWLHTFRWYVKSIWNTDFLLELAETFTTEWRSQIVITSVNKWVCCFPGGYEAPYWAGSAGVETYGYG